MSNNTNTAMNRTEALEFLRPHIKNEKTINHCLASEAVLRAVAERLGKDQEKWALAGLLHDLDIELTNADLNTHGSVAQKMLKERGIDPEIIDAIVRHNECATDLKRETPFHHALAAGETITGLITATALVYPNKKLASVKVKSITKRMKEKAFAASVNRDIIRECELIGIPLNEFAEISLNAMQQISEDLGM